MLDLLIVVSLYSFIFTNWYKIIYIVYLLSVALGLCSVYTGSERNEIDVNGLHQVSGLYRFPIKFGLDS